MASTLAKLFPLTAAFFAGILVASLNPVHRELLHVTFIQNLSDLASKAMYGAFPPSCVDLYSHYPVGAAYSLADIEPASAAPPGAPYPKIAGLTASYALLTVPHSIDLLGLSHISIASRAHFGQRGVEVWIESKSLNEASTSI